MKDSLGIKLLEMRVKAVLPHIRGHLLDVGCGTNLLKNRYKGTGIGVDVYPWPGADMVVPDTAKLPFKDSEFDTVTIVAALNHIPNREAVLREAHRVLKSDGRILITMIPPGISRVWHFLRYPWDADQSERGMIAGEVFGFSEGQMKNLLTTADFKLDEVKRFMFGINRIYMASKVSTKKVSINSGRR